MDDEYERCTDGVWTEEIVAYQQFVRDPLTEPVISEERINYISSHIRDCERCSRIYKEVEETNRVLDAAFGKMRRKIRDD